MEKKSLTWWSFLLAMRPHGIRKPPYYSQPAPANKSITPVSQKKDAEASQSSPTTAQAAAAIRITLAIFRPCAGYPITAISLL